MVEKIWEKDMKQLIMFIVPVALQLLPDKGVRAGFIGIQTFMWVVVLLLMLAVPVQAQSLDKGMQALQREDYPAALQEWLALAEQGIPNAQVILGCMYRGGQGVRQDHREAARWFRLAAEQGMPQAQAFLGEMHYGGQGVIQDYREAARWFRLAAEQGMAEAQALLGGMYYMGQGVRQDLEQAARWLGRAAEQGIAEAQAALGAMYADGEGVEQDYVQAYKWLSLSAAQGVVQGKEYRDSLAREMSSSQIAEARQQADEWLQRSAGRRSGD